MPYPVFAIQLLGQTIDGGALKIQGESGDLGRKGIWRALRPPEQ